MLIHRYLFKQIALSVLAACAALAAIGLLSQSLNQLEVIVERGQSAWVMLKLTALAVPRLLSVILPVGVFIGCLLALNRLHREQELVMCFAGGMSRWRVAAPAIRIGVLAALASLVINLFLQPAAQGEARETAYEVRTDLAAVLVREGEFVRAPGGLTVYVQQVDQNGLIRNLFIHRETDSGATTWDADTARFDRIDDRPVLVMRNGSTQQFSSSGVLNFLSFDQYTFDLQPFVTEGGGLRLKESDRWLHELVFPTEAVIAQSGPRPALLAEAHARISSPLYNLTAVALALAAVLGGPFSRTGYTRRIATAAGVFLAVRVIGYGVLAGSSWNPWLNIIQYLLPVGVAALGLRAVLRGPRALPARARRMFGRLLPGASA